MKIATMRYGAMYECYMVRENGARGAFLGAYYGPEDRAKRQAREANPPGTELRLRPRCLRRR